MPELGQSMNDFTGWVEAECSESIAIHDYPENLGVSSALTDIDGNYGQPVIYTEWFDRETGLPVVRDYIYNPHTENAKCKHWVPSSSQPERNQSDV